MSDVTHDALDYVPPLEVEEEELYHAKTWLGKYVFCQDAKVIAIQYSLTAIGIGVVALVLSLLMRLQLGFPHEFSIIDPSNYLQFVTMHGMIMVIYLLTALFLGGFGNYLIPLMCGSRDMVFPYMNMLSFWVYFLSVIVLLASFFVPGGSTGAGWTLYPPQAILTGTPGATWGILLMLISLGVFIVAFTMGGLNYVTTVLQARCNGMTLMRMPLSIWGIFMATVLGLLAFPALLVTTLLLVAAFGMFAFAEFVPNRIFGILVAAILSLALITDALLLPALLMRRGAPVTGAGYSEPSPPASAPSPTSSTPAWSRPAASPRAPPTAAVPSSTRTVATAPIGMATTSWSCTRPTGTSCTTSPKIRGS